MRGCLRVDVQHGGEGKRNGFSGARLGDSYDITAGESHGPCLALNGCWLCEALVLDGSEEVVGEANLIKIANGSRDVPALYLDKFL